MNYLTIAYQGRVNMLQTLFGSREPPPVQNRVKAGDIKQFAKMHNLLVRTGKVKLPKRKAK